MIKYRKWNEWSLLGAGMLAFATSAAVALGQGTATQGDAGVRATTAGPTPQQAVKHRAEKLKRQLENPYRKWLHEDVVYIITDEERRAYNSTHTDKERDQFTEAFWLRRDPTPDTVENEFKEEHYRRIAYANERFASIIPGWETDRGRIYITYGPPDLVVKGISEDCESPAWPEQNGAQEKPCPFEKWHYRFLEGIGTNVDYAFLDSAGSRQYHLTPQLTGKITFPEADDVNRPGTHREPLPQCMDDFALFRRATRAEKAPVANFASLKAEADSKIAGNVLPMLARVDIFPVTSNVTLTKLTVEFDHAGLRFNQTGPDRRAVVDLDVFVRTTSLRATTAIRDVVRVNRDDNSLYQRSIPLPPGTYRLNIFAKDTLSGHMSDYETLLDVPRLEADRPMASSLELVEGRGLAASWQAGKGHFILCDSMIRPRMDSVFRSDESLGAYLQVYNLGADEKTLKPRGVVAYEFVKAGDNSKGIPDYSEDLGREEGSASETTIMTLLPLRDLEPGKYILRVKIDDNVRRATVTQAAEFSVQP